MGQERKLRDGTIAVANTIYIPKVKDLAASDKAKLLNRIHKIKVNKWTKSKVIVDVVNRGL